MNLEQAKAKLGDVRCSIGDKYPEVLVSELCIIVQFLLSEVERLESKPTFLKLSASLPSDTRCDPPRRRRDTMPLRPEDPVVPIKKPNRSRPLTTDHPNRKGNAGDAE